MSSESADVFVVGGGPVGLAAAIVARNSGFRVTLADPAWPPIDKPCGEGLLPDTRAALAAMGISIAPASGAVIRGIRFIDGNSSAQADFLGGTGVGVRRTKLHQILADQAAECGVDLCWGTRVTGLCEGGVRVGRDVIRARWIVGADGGNSRVRRWSGLDVPVKSQRRFAYRRHYQVPSWTEHAELHWGEGRQIYVTPIGPQEVCVAVTSRDPHLRLDAALGEFPALAAKLQQGTFVSAERGAVNMTLRLRRVCRGRVALVGDASGGVDAITGEGLSLGFRQAMALVESLKEGSLEHYGRAHGRICRRPSLMATLMLLLDSYPSLRRRVIRVFSEEPRLFTRFLAAHTGAAAISDVAAAGARLSWRMLSRRACRLQTN